MMVNQFLFRIDGITQIADAACELLLDAFENHHALVLSGGEPRRTV